MPSPLHDGISDPLVSVGAANDGGCEGERTVVPPRGWALGEWSEPRSYCCICDISLCRVTVGCTHHHIGATVLKLLGFSAAPKVVRPRDPRCALARAVATGSRCRRGASVLDPLGMGHGAASLCHSLHAHDRRCICAAGYPAAASWRSRRRLSDLGSLARLPVCHLLQESVRSVNRPGTLRRRC